ncbi:MAG: hypothetical protein NTZ93_01745 [Candidatus Beckwithbacteria bacterium]|nr:hypothetical protein [Candidatus Beckwithbacteria bacterium]
MTKKLNWLICLILFLAAFLLRLYKIDQVTPGMWGDEITVGQASENLLLSRQITPFVDVNYGHPTPLLYLTGLAIKLFGRSVFSLRLTSVIFGSLDIAIFYLFLRRWQPLSVSLAASLAFLFSYPHLIVSRFAYEMTAAIFFQILAALFLYQKKYLALGLALGTGLFTYLGFRPLALVFLLLALIINFKKINRFFLVLGAAIFISSPLLYYSLQQPDQFWARAKNLSVFHQNLPTQEIVKEVLGAAQRSSLMIFTTGDPNPRQNPAGKPAFDPLTACLLFTGLVILFRRQRRLFFIWLLFSLTVFFSDIFSLERIPEFHYYGLGHPNILRLSGLIPLVYFSLAFGLNQLKKISLSFMTILTVIIIVINYLWYFQQPISRFNYYVNGAGMLELAKIINAGPYKTVATSSQIINDQRIQYFVSPQISLKLLTLPFSPDQLTIIDSALASQSAKIPSQFTVKPFFNPWQETDALLIFPPH